jgi:hypothetical protein
MSRSRLRAIEKLFDLPNAGVSDCVELSAGWPKRAAIMDWRNRRARQFKPARRQLKFLHTRSAASPHFVQNHSEIAGP